VRPCIVLLALSAAVAGACSGPVYTPPPLSSVPCAVPGFGSLANPWRQVHAAGFSFCVPGSWQPSGGAPQGLDAHVWRGPGGAISWAAEAPRPLVIPRDCVTTRNATTGQEIGTTCTPTDDLAPRCSAPTKSSEEVSGSIIEVTQSDCGASHVTSATASGIYLRAAAYRSDVAALELTVIRSIRRTP
jgi:hypothetical protein